MARATVLILDSDLGDVHAETLRRLNCNAILSTSAEIDAAEMPDVVVIGGRDIEAAATIRRNDPSVPLLFALDVPDLDVAAAVLGLDHIAFVAAPWFDEAFVAALSELRFARRAPGFAEGDAGYGLRLAALGEEIARIARAIEPPMALADAPPAPQAPLAFDPATLRAVLKARRQRDALFAPGIFADPAWDMLLDLTAARGEGKRVAVSSLAIAASVPPTTALRHLKAMVGAGLVVRRADPDDGRRAYVDLSEDAFARMRAWVAGLAKAM